MKMNKIIAAGAIALLVLIPGCANTFDLDEKWLPLEQIVERPGGTNWVTTVGSSVYVGDIDEFFKRNPLGSVEFRSLMSHELVHSWRQEQRGAGWFVEYLTSREFRLREELIGYYVEYRIDHSMTIEHVVNSLSDYSPSMGSEEEIRAATVKLFNSGVGREELPPQLGNELGNN